MFSYNYSTGETYKFPDTSDSPSEFLVLSNGDALSTQHGDIFITKNFTTKDSFSRDFQLTYTDDYEYSPMVKDEFLIYRRVGNYFITLLDTIPEPELQLTKDESDSISYQILELSEGIGKNIRVFFARYDNSPKRKILFPDYNNEFVTVDKQKRGISKVQLLEFNISPKKNTDTLTYELKEITYPDSTRYSTQYAVYSPDKRNLVLDAETLDRHVRKLYNYDISSGKIKEIYSESDTAWFERHGNATRFIDSNTILFESEISGYNNLYKININGSNVNKTAGGDYTILESVVDTKNGVIYFDANKDDPVNYAIYKININGGSTEKLTTDAGDYSDLSISQDGEYLFYTHSYINKPGEIYSLNISSGIQSQVTNTISPKFTSVDWTMPELVTFNNKEDGQLIHAFLYKPKDFSSKKKYPLICFVHGSGYLQEVTDGYSPYGDNFMVNTFLTEHGYMILDVDFRGSAGYGKEFRNKTHRNLGYWEVSDYISGIDYLDKLGMIERNKVGIYGGSYGGFITLMAAFRHPDYFNAAVCLRGVSNWKNYFYSNQWFTLARLGDYNEAEIKPYYESSSSITYAGDLQIPLLIMHGMLDDNVFFQDAVQLIQKLIELKKDFDVMIYPKEYHSFHIQSSWLDQYKRIFNFFERHLK
jgi:dipeptidyl aminopeptidase/acylaminoacyl peptidase